MIYNRLCFFCLFFIFLRVRPLHPLPPPSWGKSAGRGGIGVADFRHQIVKRGRGAVDAVEGGEGGQIEVLAQGLPLWHGAQLAADATLTSPVGRDGEARHAAATTPGDALHGPQAHHRLPRVRPEPEVPACGRRSGNGWTLGAGGGRSRARPGPHQGPRNPVVAAAHDRGGLHPPLGGSPRHRDAACVRGVPRGGSGSCG